MADFLENLRKKNNQEKKAFALMSAALVAGSIFLVWLLTTLTTWDSKITPGSIALPTLDELIEETAPESILPETPFTIVWSTTTEATTTATTTSEE